MNKKYIEDLFMNMTFDFKRNLQTVITALFVVFSSFAYAETVVEDNVLAEKLNQNWNALFNSGDAKAVAQLYSETAILSTGDGQILKGQKEVEALFLSFVVGGVHNHEIEVVDSYRDGNTLYQVSNWSASGQEADGVTPTFGGVVTLISKLNEQGEWKLQLHSWNVAN
jgi:ketosteroid isomerase-like protein